MSQKKELRDPCVRCFLIPDEKDEFCRQCGAPLRNRCSDEKGLRKKGCGFINKPDAAFCVKCGEPTIFNRKGLVKPFM
jgi:hypothetical protein